MSQRSPLFKEGLSCRSAFIGASETLKEQMVCRRSRLEHQADKMHNAVKCHETLPVVSQDLDNLQERNK